MKKHEIQEVALFMLQKSGEIYIWTCLVAICILFIQIIVKSNMECAKFWNSLLQWLAWIVHQILLHCFLRPGIHLLPVLAVSNSVTGMTSTCHREYSHIICISTIHHLLSSSILRLLTLHHNTSPIIVSYHSYVMSCHTSSYVKVNKY